VNDELGRMWMETVVAYCRIHFIICLEVLRKTAIAYSRTETETSGRQSRNSDHCATQSYFPALNSSIFNFLLP